ncbi:hypothetical protein CBS115989_9123 [Aspergillus niger]|uniref:Contig An12c0080, genomic contig n=3 Tax=Aspergillus niger TaxID=5061 RepID=A2QYZ4_ASPNC|nr:uncharacterized protein An12g03050 [Aspergillus niger]XP_025453724.1 uncharacterized protein BO96DRAFT_476767 [Aspergillus niger CBS 101883]RDH16463.1 hypothetical protein M747DRAFT_358437 [Aspergillus niger ATCC 13496]KAI2813750.1 hypothetical protein CBS115989_9123 [Aspergillus niger]KAI2825462.1 hypothetical protein CBS133816_8483 [Aspergillus niger]KAI2851636.1 hypothetical protein CBS12448_8426 [Aspergillus niger]KAI2895221.1 hypothetical protein CBS13152_3928 [Aspergillus niger]|eukprot:XP_001395383.1 hypothetical protein ANI_1_1622104 [Aspergillus niger CBS 513.88]
MWDFSFTGRVFDIDGKKLMVLEQLTEFLDFELGQRRVLTRVINMENNLQSLLKICYQLDPEDFDLVDSAEAESAEELAEEHYCHEVQLTALLGERGLGPKYYHHETQFQEEWMPFPDGYIDFLVMQIPPGENVDVIQDELTDRQLESIRTQLAHILETMRKNGYKLVQQHAGYLNYEAQTNKLYLVDLDCLGFSGPKSSRSFPIDEESPYVEAFNIWRTPYSKPEQDQKPGMPPPDQPTKKENQRPSKT